MRFCRCSLPRIFLRWFFAVLSEITRLWAISWFDFPSTTSWRTYLSRSVSGSVASNPDPAVRQIGVGSAYDKGRARVFGLSIVANAIAGSMCLPGYSHGSSAPAF